MKSISLGSLQHQLRPECHVNGIGFLSQNWKLPDAFGRLEWLYKKKVYSKRNLDVTGKQRKCAFQLANGTPTGYPTEKNHRRRLQDPSR